MGVSEQLRFLWQFVRHPKEVGSVVPSSRYLACAVVEHVSPRARCVAEFGPGTGPITRVLLERLGPAATVLALEIDPAFCAVLRRELADHRLRVVEAPAQELPARARDLGCAVEAVVSGLPFANFPPALRREIVTAAHDALAPGGVFAGYGYAPFALPPVLRAVFGNCATSFEWRNMPPAFVFVARKLSSEFRVPGS
ncbi:MAG: methyltransferase domain-containing protein [Chloroflexi bacterium]|nr:methyltransferase domain-containing protein [Chloroflexota bacterium]